MKDSEVIERFVTYLAQHGHQGLKVDEIPDLKERNLREIDAIAGPFAIEHTSIDTVPNQRRNDDWFQQVIDGLEQELSDRLSFYLYVILEYGAVKTGQDWRAIRQALKSWIVGQAKHLSDGDHVLDDVPGIPFKLHVHKETDVPRTLFFARIKPNDDFTLSSRIKSQLDRKAKKLAKYHLCGKTTILLVESSDYALMNRAKMQSAIKEGFGDESPLGVDEVWYAERFEGDSIRFTNFTTDLR